MTNDKDPTRELISQREYARRRGISNVAVWRAVQNGRITLFLGKIDPVAADREWEANTDISKPRNRLTGRPKAGARKRKKKKEPSTPVPMDLDGSGAAGGNGNGNGDGKATGYAKARAERESYEAELAKLKLNRQLGVLLSADDVAKAAFDSARKTRDLLFALRERLKPNLSPEQFELLDNGINELCRDLSGTTKRP